MTYLYVIVDPRDYSIYIGISNDVPRRIVEHFTSARELGRFSYACIKDKWLWDMLNKGIEPVIYVLSGYESRDMALSVEKRLIELYANECSLIVNTQSTDRAYKPHRIR